MKLLQVTMSLALMLHLYMQPAYSRTWTEFREALDAGKKDKQVYIANEAYITGLRDGLIRASRITEYEPGKQLFCYPDSSKLIDASEIIRRLEKEEGLALKIAPDVVAVQRERQSRVHLPFP